MKVSKKQGKISVYRDEIVCGKSLILLLDLKVDILPLYFEFSKITLKIEIR